MRILGWVLAFGLACAAGPSLAQEQPDEIKAWIASDWAAKERFMAGRGAAPRRECGGDEGTEACWSLTATEISGWTLTMTSGEGSPPEAVFCIEKTGGRLRWCKDDRTGETQKFVRNGDDWDVFGR